jgi:hypothetical protein
MPDGNYFIVVEPFSPPDPTKAPMFITVTLNWFQELKRQVQVR